MILVYILSMYVNLEIHEGQRRFQGDEVYIVSLEQPPEYELFCQASPRLIERVRAVARGVSEISIGGRFFGVPWYSLPKRYPLDITLSKPDLIMTAADILRFPSQNQLRQPMFGQIENALG